MWDINALAAVSRSGTGRRRSAWAGVLASGNGAPPPLGFWRYRQAC